MPFNPNQPFDIVSEPKPKGFDPSKPFQVVGNKSPLALETLDEPLSSRLIMEPDRPYVRPTPLTADEKELSETINRLAPKAQTPEQQALLGKVVSSKLTPPLPVGSVLGDIWRAAQTGISPPSPGPEPPPRSPEEAKFREQATAAAKELESQLKPKKASGPAEFAKGSAQAVADLADFMRSPIGLSTLGIGALPKLAQRGIALAFATQMASQLPETADALNEELRKPAESRDYQKIGQLVTSGAASTLFAGIGAKYGLTGELTRPTKTEVPDAIKERTQQGSGEPEHIGVAPQRLSPETGGGNRPEPVPPIRQEPRQGDEIQKAVEATPEQKAALAQRLLPMVELPNQDLIAEPGQRTHTDILEAAGIDPEMVPHENPARKFIDPRTGQRYTRKEAEAATSIKGTAAAGGLDSTDLPRAKNKPEQPVKTAPVPQQPVTPEGGIKTVQPAPSVTEAVTPEPTRVKGKTQAGQPADEFGAIYGPILSAEQIGKFKSQEGQEFQLESPEGTTTTLKVKPSLLWIETDRPVGRGAHETGIAYVKIRSDESIRHQSLVIA